MIPKPRFPSGYFKKKENVYPGLKKAHAWFKRRRVKFTLSKLHKHFPALRRSLFKHKIPPTDSYKFVGIKYRRGIPLFKRGELKSVEDLKCALVSVNDWLNANRQWAKRNKKDLYRLLYDYYPGTILKPLKKRGWGMKEAWLLLGKKPRYPGWSEKFSDRQEAVKAVLQVWKNSDKLAINTNDIREVLPILALKISEDHGGIVNLCKDASLARIGVLKKRNFREEKLAEPYAKLLKKYGKVTSTLVRKNGLVNMHTPILKRGGYPVVRAQYTIDLNEVSKRLFRWSVFKEKPPAKPWFQHPDLIVAAKYYGGSSALLRRIKNDYSPELIETHLNFVKNFLEENGLAVVEAKTGYLDGRQNPWQHARSNRLPAIFLLERGDEPLPAEKLRALNNIFGALANENYGLNAEPGRITYFLKKPFDANPEIFNNWLDFGRKLSQKLMEKSESR